MKRNSKIHKLLCLLMVLVMTAGVFVCFPEKQAKTALAAETEDKADIRQQTVWYWHKGLPPQDGREYPVLLCWDNQYYMNVDSRMLNYLSSKGSGNIYEVSFGYSEAGFSNSGWFDKANGHSPKGQYNIELGYPTKEKNNLADLDFDYNTLKSTGSAVSFSLPNLPLVKRLPKVKPDPLSGRTEDDEADRIYLGIRPTQEMIDASGSTFFTADETNWLTGFRYMDYRVETDSILGVTYDAKQFKVYHWFLFPINSLTYNRLSDVMPGSFQNMKSGSSLTDFMNKNIDVISWFVSSRGKNRVLSTVGLKTQTGRISNSFDDAKQLSALARKDPNICLAHSGSVFCSIGNRMVQNEADMWGYLGVDSNSIGKYEFDIYYAEPNLMYFLKNDIVVENGQTQNLDGPLVIESNVQITVKDGGVLSLTDWVVNKGQINIHPGGTMILQTNTTGNGYTRNCAVISNNKENNYDGGILCDGNIIIMPNCTLEAGGIWGFQFGENAQVANYGQMIGERWNIYVNYTIEGRDSNSHMYIGYSMNDTGFGLVPEGLHPISQLGCMTQYNTPSLTRPSTPFYGKSTASTVSSTTKVRTEADRRGRVTR